MSKRAIKELDRALEGASLPTDEELAALFEMGQEIRSAYSAFTPEHHAQRVMFVQAVADRSRATWSRFVVPAAVTAVLLIGVLFVGRTALPGETFYPIREVLRTVGLAPASTEEVERFLTLADRLLDRAEAVAARSPEASERLAFAASRIIGSAEATFAELDIDDQAALADELADLIARAEAILTEAAGEDADQDADGKAAVNRGGNGPNGSAGKGRSPNDPPNAKAREDRSHQSTGGDNATRAKDGNEREDRGEQGDEHRRNGDNSGSGGGGDLEDDTKDIDKDDSDDTNSGKGGSGDEDKDEDEVEPDDDPTVDVDEIKKPALPGRNRPRG